VLQRGRNALDWLDPASQQDDRETTRNRARIIDRAPSSQCTARPPGQGLGPAPHCYCTVRPPHESRCEPAQRDTSSPSLCSRLVFKCTRCDTRLPGRRFRVVKPTEDSSFRAVGWPTLVLASLDSRQLRRLRHAQPRMAVRLVPLRPAVVETSTSKGPGVPGHIPMSLVRRPPDRMPRLQTPRFSCSASPASRFVRHSQGPIRDPPHQRRNHHGPRRLPTDKSRCRPARAVALSKFHTSRHRSPASPPWKRLPAGIHDPPLGR
jgi:hypothetical protein